jgi:hypothetical protein
MTFNIGDTVRVQNNNVFARGRGRVQRVMAPSPIGRDFQEYVVEFASFHSERFRFGLCREFEMLAERPASEAEKD